MTIRARLLLLLVPPLTAFFVIASFFFYFNWSREILLLGSCIILLLVIGTVFLIADRMSKPVRQLNQAALKIAAGDYETNIQLDGPKEIMELAHTFNTMSQCLVEHMSRLRESSLIRERMYGEYECALLLQHYMLQKVINDYHDPHIRLCLISAPLSNSQKGLLLKIDALSSSNLELTLIEAEEQGFSGLFQLNQWIHLSQNELKEKAYLACQFVDHFHFLHYESHILFPPLVWSVQTQQFVKGQNQILPLKERDIVFLYNSELIVHFSTVEEIEKWLSKILRHFAEDGLEAIQRMLTNEFTFLAKKQQTNHNFKMIALEINRPQCTLAM